MCSSPLPPQTFRFWTKGGEDLGWISEQVQNRKVQLVRLLDILARRACNTAWGTNEADQRIASI